MDTDDPPRIYGQRKGYLYLRENRHDRGVSDEMMAARLGIGRTSLLRWEREQRRMNPEKQAAYAHALGMEPEDLWYPPGRQSVDAVIRSAPADVQAMATDLALGVVRRLVAK